MKYWTFKHQPGQNQPEDACRKFVEKAIRLNSTLMQYEYGPQPQGSVTSNWNCIKDNLKEGDTLFLRGGERIYAFGIIIKPRKDANEVLSMADVIDKKSHDGFRSDKYNGCIHFDDCPIFYEDLSEGEGEWGQRIDVLAWKYYFHDGIDCKDQDNYVDNSRYNVVRELKKHKAEYFIKQLKNKFMGRELQLLEENKNLILTGAPGTGKTFLTREMALKLIFGKADEGLLSEEEKSAFKKQYCFVQFHPSYDYTDFIEGLRPFGEGQIGFKRQDGVFKDFCKRALVALKEDENRENDLKRNFIFVIDEINRGEISKIFGELFFSIDPSYRGTKGLVQTQYTNLIPNDDDFAKGFYVPENVYIIGTMNDIDRSVESFDFAMRRRFVWYEITAKDSFVRMGLGTAEEYEEHPMGKLNKAISNIPSLNSSYHVGAAYFLKNKDKNDATNYAALWDLRLKPLLKEYLRGMPDAKEQLAQLHKAFAPDYTGDSEE